MPAVSETLQHIFFGGTKINGFEALSYKKNIDFLRYSDRKVELLKRPAVMALSAVKATEALASMAFVIKTGVLAFGPAIYTYLGANPGEVDQSRIGISLFYAAEHALASLGSHYLQTKIQGES